MQDLALLNCKNDDVKARVNELVDAHLPHLGEAQWDGDEPHFASVLNDAFCALENKVKEAASSTMATDDGAGLSDAGSECGKAMKDRQLESKRSVVSK